MIFLEQIACGGRGKGASPLLAFGQFTPEVFSPR